MMRPHALLLTLVTLLALAIGTGCKAKPDTAALDACEAARTDLQGQLDAMRAQMSELESKNARYQAMLDRRMAIDKELRDKLKGLIDGGKLRIGYRRGLMILELPQDVLFDPGKAVVKEDAKALITEVSQALATIQDRRLLVAGHTDSDPIKARKSTYPTNWELSTARSQAVVNLMINDGVSANNVGVSGFGEFDPIGDNSTPEGKQSNRRIEIVLIPNLEEILKMEQAMTEMEGGSDSES